jgi:hypothetical protein
MLKRPTSLGCGCQKHCNWKLTIYGVQKARSPPADDRLLFRSRSASSICLYRVLSFGPAGAGQSSTSTFAWHWPRDLQ